MNTIELQTTTNTAYPIQNTTSAKTVLSDTFSTLLEKASTSAAQGKADVISGRIGIDFQNGKPGSFVYFNEDGIKLTASSFSAKNLYKYTEKFGIDINNVAGLKDQLESMGVGYKPYELYAGTGSSDGIDFDDILNGGLGTNADWSKIDTADIKLLDSFLIGTAAEGQNEKYATENAALASRLGLVKNQNVTSESGLSLAHITAQTLDNGNVLPNVLFQGGAASWYQNQAQAQTAQNLLGGILLSIDSTSNTISQLSNVSDTSTEKILLATENTTVQNLSTTSTVEENTIASQTMQESLEAELLKLTESLTQLQNVSMTQFQTLNLQIQNLLNRLNTLDHES